MENRNLEKFIIGIVLIVLILIAILVGTKEEEKMISVPIEEEINYELKDAYITGCMGEDISYGFCVCTYNVLFEDLGRDGFIDLSLNYMKTGQIPESVLNNVINSCITE